MDDLFEQHETVDLKAEREKTLQHLAHLREALKSEVGPTTDRKDPNLREHEMVLAQIQVLEHKLQWLDDALQQVRQGSYGLCKHCGDPIDPARLEVLPEATLCVECKIHLESQVPMRTTLLQPQIQS
jgi:RNA polymerase-binding transcription factor DksA